MWTEYEKRKREILFDCESSEDYELMIKELTEELDL